MVHDKLNPDYAPLGLRAKALSLCTVCFFSIYLLAGYYADYQNIDESILLPNEEKIPFIAWFIIPYTSSSILFIYQFYLTTNKSLLRLLTYRTLFVTAIAGIMYFTIPLHFKFEKPPVENEMLDFFVHLFKSYDNSYNQMPSLHVCFACLFYTVILQKPSNYWKKILWFVWVVLIILSTVFVYQHHVIDVIAALILIGVTLIVFPEK